VPTASPSPLREIGHVRAGSTICGNLVVHANSAIDAALQADGFVERAIARLRATDFETNNVGKRNGVNELSKLAAATSDQSLHGEAELKRLREAASAAEGVPQNPDLRTFADALSGAFGRQHRIAVDLSNFLSYLDYRDMRDVPSIPTSSGNSSRRGGIDPNQSFPVTAPTMQSDPYAQAGTPNRKAVAAATDFEARAGEIRGDETTASRHSEAAVSGCS
jgi:hypothetical protein